MRIHWLGESIHNRKVVHLDNDMEMVNIEGHMEVIGGKGLVSMVVQSHVEEGVHRHMMVVVDSPLEVVVAKRVDQILVVPPIFDCSNLDACSHCEMETLHEYWEHFKKLLDSCPHHRIDDLVLISYFCQGLKPQDKILLDASSIGFLVKFRMAEEAWQLISDLAESTQHARQRNNHPKAIAEVSPSESALTKTIRKMTTILRKIHQNQQQPPLQQQYQPESPPRVCSVCA
ncbi:hypothetical protein AHAS_Ahas13G0281600 [Arachis hypogaea]